MLSNRPRITFAIAILLLSLPYSCIGQDAKPNSRHFELVYSGKIEGIKPGAQVRVWIPIAQNSRFQQIRNLEVEHFAESESYAHDEKYANRMMYLEAVAQDDKPLEFRLTYDIIRYEVQSLKKSEPHIQLRPEQESIFLSASRLVPIDGRPLTLLDGVDLSEQPMLMVRDLYDVVNEHMTYDKSKDGYGNGDVLWACDSGTGNCTDFHSLFLSLARSRNFPAYFEIGFPIPEERGNGKIGGYHCWANCFVKGHGWVPVDISEADKDPTKLDYFFGNLNENRVTFSIGRDIRLEPEAAEASLNYFVYPHVEVDGEAWPADRIKLDFQYRDIAD